MDLGRFGIWTALRGLGEDSGPDAVALAQDLGFGAFWLGGSPRLPSVRPLLESADRIVVATGIVNVWQYEPAALADEFAHLAPDYPDRLLVGIGIGHPEATSEYGRPLSTMRSFLDGLDDADPPLPGERRCLAALGPRMLDLCAARSRGTLTYFVPVEHTRFARERLGEGLLLATELACVLDTDATAAREKARAYAEMYLGLRNYTSNLQRFGFTERDIADGGSDRLIDAIVPHGTAEQIAAVAREHIAAGADHVCLQPVGVSGVPRAEWSALAARWGRLADGGGSLMAATARAVLLDVNGTLTDPAPIGAPWGRPELGERALADAIRTAIVAALLGQGERPFSDHLRAAIRVLVADEGLDPGGIDDAISAASQLPARPDAADALSLLADAGVRAVALTNSGAEAGTATLSGCGLIRHVERVLGVDAVGSFKPDPRVYAYALAELSTAADDVVMLATHPFDLAGAAHAGMRTAWVTHGARGWPDIYPEPTFAGETLTEVARALAGRDGAQA